MAARCTTRPFSAPAEGCARSHPAAPGPAERPGSYSVAPATRSGRRPAAQAVDLSPVSCGATRRLGATSMFQDVAVELGEVRGQLGRRRFRVACAEMLQESAAGIDQLELRRRPGV